MGRDRIRGGCLHVGKCVWIRKGSDRMYNVDSLNNGRITNTLCCYNTSCDYLEGLCERHVNKYCF